MHLARWAFVLGWLCCAIVHCRGSEPETGGVGIGLSKKGEQIIINVVIANTPAAKSGEIKKGDRLLAVASGDAAPEKVDGRSIPQVKKLLIGPAGTTVRLTIVPEGKDQSQARTVTLQRAVFNALWGDGVLLKQGTVAPDVAFTRLADDQSEELADHRGKIVVLTFWASWCGPCQEEMAALQTLAEKNPSWKDKVVLLAASVDDEPAKAVKHLKEKGWDKTRNLWTETKTLRTYHVDGIPTSYVIDAEGKIAAADPKNIADAVNELLVAKDIQTK
jgi:thiol-disulfide isomerase/thioredoxin